MRTLCACLSATVLALLVGTPAPARADSPLRWSGFGTVAAIWQDDDEVFFNHPGKARDDQRLAHLDGATVLGLQATFGASARTDFTVQLLLTENRHSDYAPSVAWAYLRHDLLPDLSLRAGRLRAPFFMHSDSLNVNFAHPWVRPPVEVYGLNPVAQLDGIDLIFSRSLGAIDVELQPYVGTGRADYPDGHVRVRHVVGVSANLSRGNTRVQLSHAEARIDLTYGDPLYLLTRDALVATGNEHIVAQLSGKNARANFSTIGFQSHHGPVLLTGELARRGAERFLSTAYGWHLTAAYQVGAFTPFITVARQNLVKPVVRTAETPAFMLPYLHSRTINQSSIAVGSRWDFSPNRAAKLQWTRNWIEPDAWGAFFPRGSTIATTPAGRRVDMLNLSLDFTF